MKNYNYDPSTIETCPKCNGRGKVVAVTAVFGTWGKKAQKREDYMRCWRCDGWGYVKKR